jgi:deoxyribonuclease V
MTSVDEERDRGAGPDRFRLPADWPTTVDEALAHQRALSRLVDTTGPELSAVTTVAGLDSAYDPGSDRLVGAAVVLDAGTLQRVEAATAPARARFPYVPGLLAFREVPGLLAALDRLRTVPDLLVCDGYGIAHPRRLGLACHVGILTGLPTIGVAKTPFVGTHDALGPRRGDAVDLVDDGAVVGRVLRTRDGTRPVYVSVGHRVALDVACRWVLRLSPRYRQPEVIRAADQLARAALRSDLRPACPDGSGGADVTGDGTGRVTPKETS